MARLTRLKAFATAAGAMGVVTLLGGLGGVFASRALGPHERGILATAVVWSSVLGFLVSAGVPQAATHFAAREAQRRAAYASAALAVAIVAGAALTVVGVGGALLLVRSAASVPMAIVFGAALPMIVGAVTTGVVLGTETFGTWSLLRIAEPGLYLAGILLITVADVATAIAVATVLALAATAQAVVGLRVLRGRGLLTRPERQPVKEVLAYGWRNVLAGAGWLVSYRLDQLVLSFAVTASSLGIYAVASSFGEIIVPVGAAAGSVMLARVSASGATEVRRTLPLALGLCFTCAAALACFAFVTAPDLIRLLFGSRFAAGESSLRILMPGAVALALSTVLADTLRGLRRPLVPVYAEVIGACATAILLLILVPDLGIKGAAIASSVSYGTVTICLVVSVAVQLRKHGDDGEQTAAAPELADLTPRI